MAFSLLKVRASRRAALSLLALTAVGLVGAQAVSAKPKPQPAGRIKVFAPVAAVPGFPEGIVVEGNLVYVSGPARFGTAGTGPSVIRVFDRRTHVLKTTIPVTGEDLAQEHAQFHRKRNRGAQEARHRITRRPGRRPLRILRGRASHRPCARASPCRSNIGRTS